MANEQERAPLTLIGLCADWCGACREFEPEFCAVAAAHAPIASAWLDVEDPEVSSALGEIDIEIFPTIALGRGQRLLFWGEVLPRRAVLERLLQSHWADTRLDRAEVGSHAKRTEQTAIAAGHFDAKKTDAWALLTQLAL